MKRTAPLRRTKPLARSPWRWNAQQRRRRDDWKRQRELALARDGHWPTCEQNGIHPGEQCRGGLEVHHKLPRSAGGGHDLDNLLTLCSYGHQVVHAHPTESYDRGWLIRRGAA